MVSETQKRQIVEIAGRYEVAFVVLFGSVAEGTERGGSDIDVAVMRRDRARLSYTQFRDITDELSSVFDGTFSKVDVVDLASANILLRHEITSRGTLLCGDADQYGAYRIFAFRDYVDSRSLRDLEEALTERRQKALHAAIHG